LRSDRNFPPGGTAYPLLRAVAVSLDSEFFLTQP